MRILHLVHQYPPEALGGTEFYTKAVAEATAKQGHPAAVFTPVARPGQGEETQEEGGVTVHRVWHGIPTASQRFRATLDARWMLRPFVQLLNRFQPDLVHVQHLMGLPAALLSLLRRRKIPYVLTLHDFWWFCANAQLVTNYDHSLCQGPHFYLNCTRCAIARSGTSLAWGATPALLPMLLWRGHLLRSGLQGASCILTATEFVRQQHVAQGIAPERITLLPLGIESPSETPLASPHPHTGPLRVAYVGGLAWQKGVHILVEAATRLGALCELRIGGDLTLDPTYVANLQARAGDNVHFLGRLNRKEVWETLAWADVVAIPSLWYETFSLLAHEAFAAGTPVIASELGALAEVVRHQIDGLLVPPGDVAAWEAALRRICQTPDLLAEWRMQIQPPLTVEEHVQRLLAIYREVEENS